MNVIKLSIFLLLTALPIVSYATKDINLDMPIVYYSWMHMILFLYIVIFIDFFYLEKIITLTKFKTFRHTLLANLITFFLVIPIAFTLVFLLQYLIFGVVLHSYIIEKEPSFLFIKSFFPAYYDYPEPKSSIDSIKLVRNNSIIILMFGLIVIYALYISFYTKYLLLKKWLKIKKQSLLRKYIFRSTLIFYFIYSIYFILVIFLFILPSNFQFPNQENFDQPKPNRSYEKHTFDEVLEMIDDYQ